MNDLKLLATENIFWAVDVFSDIESMEAVAAKNILSFAKNFSEPVNITPVNVFPGIHMDESFPFATEEIRKRLAKIRGVSLNAVKVIPESMIYPTSVDDKVSALVEYAKAHRCDLIVATTHSTQTASHYVMGSFTKELLFKSQVPLLIMNPHCEMIDEYQNILCPHDVGDFSSEELKRLSHLSRKLNAKVVFQFHIEDQAGRYFNVDSPMWSVFKGHQKKREEHIEIQIKNLKQSLHGQIENYEIRVERNTKNFNETVSDFVDHNRNSLVLFNGVGTNLNKKVSKYLIEHVIRHVKCPTLIVK